MSQKRVVLIYGNRKEPETTYDISTPELRAKGFLTLFKHLDKDWQVYSTGWEDDVVSKLHLDLYKKAKKGDAEAAELLLSLRKDYQYEEWRIEESEEQVTEDGIEKVTAKRTPVAERIKELRWQGRGGTEMKFNVRMANGAELDFIVLPVQAQRGSWDALRAILSLFEDALDDKFGEYKSRDDRMDKALTLINELRIGMWAALHPETQRWPFDIPSFVERKAELASAFLKDNGTSEVYQLAKKVRRDPAMNRDLALGELVNCLRSALDLLTKVANHKLAAEHTRHDVKRLNEVLMKYGEKVL